MDSPSKIRISAKMCLRVIYNRAGEYEGLVCLRQQVLLKCPRRACYSTSPALIIGTEFLAFLRDAMNSRTSSIVENTLSLLRELQG